VRSPNAELAGNPRTCPILKSNGIYTNKSEIDDLPASFRDHLATNPDGTAGVYIPGPESCVALAKEQLADLSK